MYARVARYRIPVETMDEALDGFRHAIDSLRQIDGSEGGYLLVDRDNSTALTVTLWTDRVAMEASEVHASRLRSEAVASAGGEIVAVDRCEVAIDFTDLASI